MNPINDDAHWMRIALDEARAAATAGEVPVGCVIVRDGVELARGANARETLLDATAHAEMQAISAACRSAGDWRLTGCDLYVTLEPCPMCLGACLHARLRRVVYGAREPKFGACGSVVDLRAPPGFNHALSVAGGVMAEESAALLKAFFRDRRASVG